MGHKRPTVYVEPRAYHLMSLWARLGGRKSREMTCFGRAQLYQGKIIVTDAYMVAHEADSAGVDADDDDINALMFELDQKGVPPDEAFRCWIHSHPGTGPKATYLSMTDEAMIDRFMLGDWLVSIVFDSVGESPYCRIDYKNPRSSVEADVEINWPYLSQEDVKWAEEIYKKKARDKPQPKYLGKYSKGKGKGKGGNVSVSSRGNVMRSGWEQDDSLYEFDPSEEWPYHYGNEEADADDGTEYELEDPKSEEYEMTTAEYANFSSSMAVHVDNIAAQVLYGEVHVLDAMHDLVSLGFSAAQAADELEERLGSPVSSWADDESAIDGAGDADDDAVPVAVQDQTELPIEKKVLQ